MRIEDQYIVEKTQLEIVNSLPRWIRINHEFVEECDRAGKKYNHLYTTKLSEEIQKIHEKYEGYTIWKNYCRIENSLMIVFQALKDPGMSRNLCSMLKKYLEIRSNLIGISAYYEEYTRTKTLQDIIFTESGHFYYMVKDDETGCTELLIPNPIHDRTNSTRVP